MRLLTRNALRVFAFLLAFSLHAVEGHWVGTIQAPQGTVQIEFDLAKDSGTFSIPARGLQSLPLDAVRIEGNSVTLEIAPKAGGGTFRGTLAGTSLSGIYTRGADSMEIPLELTRTGDARLESSAKTAVSKELDGKWSGTLDVNGTKKEIALDLTRGVITAEGFDIPISAVAQDGSNVTLDVKRIGGSWAGTLQNGELNGTWTQGPFTGALNFRRAESR